MLTLRRLAPLCLPLVLVSLAAAQETDPVVAKIIYEGKLNSKVMQTLTHLSVKIGPRVTGSPELKQAQDWALALYKSYGVPARLEQWGTIDVGFAKGPKQEGRMIKPTRREFQFATQSWTEGTKGLLRGHAIAEPKTLEDIAKQKKQLKGAWVLMEEKPGMRLPTRPSRDAEKAKLYDALSAAGIAGRVYGSKNELVHSHGSFVGKKDPKNRKTGVSVEIRASDMEAVRKALAKGKTFLEFNLDHRWMGTDVPQYNVVAEIVGSEKPDEVVIVGGHYDSWNPYGSQGTCDNGTGSAVTIEAARILAQVGAKPKRTIRFILWSGEEQGLLGSLAYVEAHKAEMDKISAVINDDGGTGYHGGYGITKEMEPMMAAAIAPLNKAFPDLPMVLTILEKFEEDWGSDHGPFRAKGIPAFDTVEGGDADYLHIWHTQNDRIDQARPNYLVQSATAAAAVAYSLANAETLLPRPAKVEEPAKP